MYVIVWSGIRVLEVGLPIMKLITKVLIVSEASIFTEAVDIYHKHSNNIMR